MKKIFCVLALSLISNIAFATKATPELFIQPLIITCSSASSSAGPVTCSGFDTQYLLVSGGDKTIPLTPISFYFSVALANADGQPISFVYHDDDLRYTAMLSPANASIYAELTAPGWIIGSTGSYYCSKESVQCPIYSK